MLQVFFLLWYQLTPYATFWQEAYLYGNNLPGEYGVTVHMRMSMFPKRWFVRRTGSISNGWRMFTEFWKIWIPSLWTVAHGLNTAEWSIQTRSAVGPLYPNMPVFQGGSMRVAILMQQAESMNTRQPVPIEFAHAIMGFHDVPYGEGGSENSSL